MPSSATMVETLTIAPPPRPAIFGASAAVRKYGARTLTSNIASKLARLSSGVGAKSKMPALLTRTSTSPTSSASRPTASKSARSAARKRAVPPAASISATASAPRAASRPLPTTSAPSAASCFATSRPIPEVPPVTSAFLPSSSMPFLSLKSGLYDPDWHADSGLSNPERVVPSIDGDESAEGEGESERGPAADAQGRRDARAGRRRGGGADLRARRRRHEHRGRQGGGRRLELAALPLLRRQAGADPRGDRPPERGGDRRPGTAARPARQPRRAARLAQPGGGDREAAHWKGG